MSIGELTDRPLNSRTSTIKIRLEPETTDSEVRLLRNILTMAGDRITRGARYVHHHYVPDVAEKTPSNSAYYAILEPLSDLQKLPILSHTPIQPPDAVQRYHEAWLRLKPSADRPLPEPPRNKFVEKWRQDVAKARTHF